MEYEDRAYEMKEQVERVLEPDITGRQPLEGVESDVDERPEEIDDAVCEDVARRHLVPGAAHPREIVVEEVVVRDPVKGDDAEGEKDYVYSGGGPR